jgi:hypothetical protein
MGTNHPLIVAHGCNLAIPTDSNEDQWNPEANDNMAYKLVDHGVAGIVGSTGIASTNVDAGDTSYGEQFINEYYEHLIRTGEGSVYSNWFGKAFLETKQNYTPNGWFFQNWDKTDKKTMLEFVYYGLPWSFMETPDNPAAAMAPLHEAQGYALTFGAPQAVDTSYTERFTMTVPSWQFTPVDTFEVLEIPGAEYLYSYGTPVQPYVLTTVNLPPGSVVTDLRLINEHAVDLGFHNIPAADPVSMYRPTTGYTSTMTVSGAYPSTRHTWDVTSYPDRVEVRIGLAPVVFNVDTGSVTLYDESVWQIDYDAAVPVLVYDLDLASEYRGDEPIDARATVENVGDSAKILDAVFKIYDTLGVLVGSQAMSPIFLDPGEILDLPLSWSGLLPHGGYKVTLAVSEGGTRLATTSGSLSVSAGDVRAFNVPVSIRSGEYGSFDLTFANYRSTGVDVTADVFVYDRHGIPVAKLLQRTFWVGPQSQGTTAWSWNPEGLAEGAYRVEAVVRAEGMVFDWPSQQLEVTGTGGSYQVYLPTLMRQATPGCGLTEQVVTGDSLPGADQDVYEFKATAGTTIDVMVDTVSLQTAFDVEACLATASSSITCFAWGDDQVPCTYPPPGYSCPQISAVLPVDGDGKYYLLVESGSGTSNYAGQFGLYRATITADPSSCLLKLVIDNQPGDFLRSLDRLK